MIHVHYPLSNDLDNLINKFGSIFNLTHNQFVLSCIGLFLTEWIIDEPARDIEPEYRPDENAFTIEIPAELSSDFNAFCVIEEFEPLDSVNGMIGFIIDYLEGVWDGDDYDHKDSPTYGVDSSDMNDVEKRELLFTSNAGDTFNKFFGKQNSL